jgi:hypothetical protein
MDDCADEFFVHSPDGSFLSGGLSWLIGRFKLHEASPFPFILADLLTA